MKELSIEEKAQRYDEAIKIAKDSFNYPDYPGFIRADVVFPELKESEDERKKKDIISFVEQAIDAGYGIISKERKEEWIAWLEKQGEHANFRNKIQIGDKVTRNEDGVLVNLSQLKRVAKPAENKGEHNMGISEATKQELEDSLNKALEKETPESLNEFLDENPADKVESKFKVSDWVVYENRVGLIIRMLKEHYIISFDGVEEQVSFMFNDRIAKWSIQDAKDGDVLVNQNGEMPFIFKECKNNYIYCYCGYTNHKDIFFDRFVDSEGKELHWSNLYHERVYPATKEQRELLFSKMIEAGYTWDAEKKELKKEEEVDNLHNYLYDEQKPVDEVGSSAFKDKLLELFQKFRYIKEGVATNGDIIDYVDAHIQELIDTVQNKPWSKEDDTKIKSIITFLKSPALCAMDGNKGIIDESIKYLKSLKDRVQPKQEWNEEDYNEIETIACYLDNIDNEGMAEVLRFIRDKYYSQAHWKPSDKQIIALLWVLNHIPYNSHKEEISGLLEDLKKLREE